MALLLATAAATGAARAAAATGAATGAARAAAATGAAGAAEAVHLRRPKSSCLGSISGRLLSGVPIGNSPLLIGIAGRSSVPKPAEAKLKWLGAWRMTGE